jgi:hypothetical protein
MKRQPVASQYLLNGDTADLPDDLIGVVALDYIDRRIRCSDDWLRLLSLRLVSQRWARIVGESLISSGILTLNLYCVHDRCPYWKQSNGSIFPLLNTLVITAAHPMASRVCALPNLLSLAIDGWLPCITQLNTLERLAVFDSDDVREEGSFITPPRFLTTLVLMDQWLIGGGGGSEGESGIVAVLRTLPKLRSLVLTNGADNIKNDPSGTEICKFVPNIEKFRWYAYYFEPYERILTDFIYADCTI